MVHRELHDGCHEGTPEKGGEVAEKGRTPEMDVAGIDICVSVCSSLKKP